ncbi:MAG: serine/threonine protein kinase, partial [Anaerolineae bacterium]|nr:serine/threonine protein kinase [Anaerolineae bacterium]
MFSAGFLIQDRYEVLALLGQGGMGHVYRGLDRQTQQPVAIKVLKPEVLAADATLLERFLREGEALRQLDHPNIVKMLQAVQQEQTHFLVMEYVEGGSLAELLQQQAPLSIHRILEIALDIADALTRAHRLNIIHRDLKPQNVLLDANGRPRLSDFGVARMGDRSGVTASGALIGTYAYVSPEVILGETVDERADIWAFGVMLFEMLTGQRPFDAEMPIAVINAIVYKPAPEVLSLRPDAPPALASLILQMLDKDPQTRIASVRLVGAELEALLRGRDTPLTVPPRFATPTPPLPDSVLVAPLTPPSFQAPTP